jgi:hypothetical protein
MKRKRNEVFLNIETHDDSGKFDVISYYSSFVNIYANINI